MPFGCNIPKIVTIRSAVMRSVGPPPPKTAHIYDAVLFLKIGVDKIDVSEYNRRQFNNSVDEEE